MLAERHLERGASATAEALARQLVALDPCREPGHRLLMLAHLADGDAAAAARQYARCVEVLRDELGIAPEPRTTAVRQLIKGGLSGRRDASSAPAPTRRTGSERQPR
jgi:DNA-binding SARP family transcriptional activator